MPCRPVRVPAALRSPLVMCLAAIVGVLAVAPAAHADLSTPKPKQGPTITFVGSGPAPLVCTSRPEPPSITIPWNSWLNVVNRTGADATLWLMEKPFELTDGAGRAFKFTVSGPYSITLVPECLVTLGDAVPLAVEVGPKPEETPAPTAPPADAKTGRSPPGASSASGDASRQTGGGVTQPGLAGQDPVGPGGSGSEASPAATAGGGQLLPELAPEDYEAYGPFPAGQTGQGFRLLAIIAAICVFGVSVAIIRVILAQRTTKSVGA